MEENSSQFLQLIKNPPHKNNGRLPLDSLLYIWAHLPLKALYKFRSVCQLWNSVISSDPLLPNLRHSLSSSETPPNLLLILRHLNSEPIKVPDRPALLTIQPFQRIIRTNNIHTDPTTHALENGFTPYVDSSLHLLPSQGPVTCFVSNAYFYLCNPSINQFSRVTPTFTTTSCGAFGYFRVENRYALISVIHTNAFAFEFGPGQARSATWREIKTPSPMPVRGFGLMVNGLFFWTTTNGPSFAVCLDYKKEEFHLIGPPQGNANEVMLYDQMYLVEYKGGICAVDNYSRPPRMEIWVLYENEREFNWVRKYNIYITGMSRDIVYPFCEYEAENGEIEMVLCNGTRSRLYCYNFKNRIVKQVYRPKQRSFEQLSLYSPGLFPLN